jgi:fumarate reductase iron-sulfur subunit
MDVVSRVFEILRYRPGQDAEPMYQTYEVPCLPDWVVLDALNAIKDDIDPTLSHRWSCRMGVCGSCGMMVSGRPVLACATFVRDLEGTIRVEPLSNFPIVRDLVVELEEFVRKIRSVKPWIIRKLEKDLAQGAYRQLPEQLDEFRQFSTCINCALCYAACPVFLHEPDYLGPAAIALAHRYNLDSRDEGNLDRFDTLYAHTGVWACTYANECSQVCPTDVDPAMAINQAKLTGALQWLGVIPKKSFT